MSYLKVHSNMCFSPKVVQAGNQAFGAWSRAAAFCSHFSPDEAFISFATAKKIAARGTWQILIRCELAKERADGYEILDCVLHYKPHGSRPRIADNMRSKICERDGFICHICGAPVDPDDVHLDHVKPFSRGGETTFDNLRVSHSRCNLSKSNKWDGVHNA